MNKKPKRITLLGKLFNGHGRHRHDPILVLNMSDFNSGSSWNRVFNPIPQRENIWR